MKKKNSLLIFISVGISILFIISFLLSNNYYENYKSILECVHIIGPLCECICPYQIGQEKIILIYKIIKISSFISIFVAFFTNLFILFVKKTSKLVKVISIISIVFYAILIVSFMLMIFSSWTCIAYQKTLTGVKGRIQTSNYEKDGEKVWTMEVIAEKVSFLSSKKADE